MTCNITGVARLPNGNPMAETKIRFRKLSGVGSLVDGSETPVIFPTDVKIITDENGEVDFDMYPGTYEGKAYPKGQNAETFLFGVPDSDTAIFGACVDLVPELDPSAVTGAVITAAAEASASADLSAAYASGTPPVGKSAKDYADDADTYAGSIQPYTSRASAEAATVPASINRIAVTAPDGSTLHYVRNTSGTALMSGDGAKWSPDGSTYPDHFAENTTPGTTDMGAAILAAIAFSPTIYLQYASYATSKTIEWNNRVVVGAGSHYSKIVGLSDEMDISDPIVRPGRSAFMSGVMVSYDALTGGEGRGERVGIDLTQSGSIYGFQRAGSLNGIILDNVGTAIYGDTFSGEINAVEIKRHSYAGIDLPWHSATGTVFGSVYINGGDAYTPVYGANFDETSYGTFFAQLNIEHQTYSGSVLRISDASSINFGVVHIEGVDISADGLAYIDLNKSSVNIGSLSILNSRMSFDDLSIFRLRDGEQQQNGTNVFFSNTSRLKIGIYHVNGLAAPNVPMYPIYPSSRRGLENIPGFKHFRRDDGHSGVYEVEVDSYNWYIYSGREGSYFGYKYPDTRYSDTDNIVFNRFDHRGEIMFPRKNYVLDGAFQNWLSTSGTATSSTDVEVLDNWFIRPGSGSLTYSRQDADIGDPNDYYMRFSNIGTPGTFQYLEHRIFNYRRLLGKRVTLSFEGRASVAGSRLAQIRATLINSGGTPASVFRQVVSGSSDYIDFATDWQRYEFVLDLADASDVSAFGSTPYFALGFNINESTASRESQIDLRRVKLEIGEGHSDFS